MVAAPSVARQDKTGLTCGIRLRPAGLADSPSPAATGFNPQPVCGLMPHVSPAALDANSNAADGPFCT